jgi:uncharacterized protein
MRIGINQISSEGSEFVEDIPVRLLELETENIKFKGPVVARAFVTKITNAVTVKLNLKGVFVLNCGRCLKEIEVGMDKNIRLDYPVDKYVRNLDISPDIREEIILDYPLKPLCDEACKGLCPKCGKNLNEGGCSCGAT